MYQANYPAGVDDDVIARHMDEPPYPEGATCEGCRLCAFLDGCEGRTRVCVRDVLDNAGTPDKATAFAVSDGDEPGDFFCEQWEAA